MIYKLISFLIIILLLFLDVKKIKSKILDFLNEKKKKN